MRILLAALILCVAYIAPALAEPAGLVAEDVAVAVARPSMDHAVYFEGTDYELNVYSVYGRRDGKTILMLGGIQGDEPGGYLSADLYSKLKLEQGNLIVIPRANLKSVILYNRGTDGDMNRLFVDDLPDTRMDYQVVKVVMQYMAQADIFLNLHDGWGFHSSTYVNEQRNPKRFGQSLIVDEDTFVCDDGTRLDLKGMAEKALAGANARIENSEHHLAYFNTQTGNPAPEFRGMQKTATWFALRNYCLPSFGVETSKNIKSVETKVLHHNYIINEFMRQLDILPENPPIYLAPAVLEAALVTVNGESRYVSDGDVIELQKNDIVAVQNIEANYASGVSCDILGFGNLNDLQKNMPIGYSTKIVFRKEEAKFAEVTLKVVQPAQQQPAKPQPASGYSFELTVNGESMSIAANATLNIKKGSTLKITQVLLGEQSTDLPVNLRGWMPHDEASNNGDDRGLEVVIDSSSMLKNFSIGRKGVKYPITVDSGGREVARMFIVLQ